MPQILIEEEERIEVERKAHWHAYVRRIGASRGQFVFQAKNI